MKKILFAFSLLLLFVFKTNAQVYKFNDGAVSFFSEAPIENIDAQSNSFNSVLNTATNEIAFIVPINSFKFKKALMQEHFNEKYMESDKYANASYKGKIIEKIDWTKNGTYTATSKGELIVHGVSKTRTDTARIIIKDGKISITSAFFVRLKDHHITVPRLVIQNIAEVIRVKFSGDYKELSREQGAIKRLSGD